jgi:hypothetical protein
MTEEQQHKDEHLRAEQTGRDVEQANRESVEARLREGQERADQIRADAAEKLKGKPTPTQEENDRAKLGEHISEHEDDGSYPDPNDPVVQQKRRNAEAGKPGEYKTRDVHRGTAATPHPNPTPPVMPPQPNPPPTTPKPPRTAAE